MGLRKTLKVGEFDKLDDAIKALYTKVDDDIYALQVEDDDSAVRLKEFRNNNIALQKTAKDLEDKLKGFDGLDAGAAREAIKIAQEMKDKKMMDEGKFNELLDQRTERMRAEYEGRVKKLTDDNVKSTNESVKYRKRLNEVEIDAKLTSAISAVGTVREGAMDDILRRGKQTWKLDDDTNAVPYDLDGNVIYGADAKTVMTPDEWAKGVAQNQPWFFEDTRGAGASGSGSRQGRGLGSTKVLDRDDKVAFGKNIEDIAGGKVKVNMG